MPPKSPYLVPFGGSFRLHRARHGPPETLAREAADLALAKAVERIGTLQKKLYADARYAVLLVFQAMDAAGKDGTIRAVLTGVNPAGCQVTSFKAPSSSELHHDFLWRVNRALPSRGQIGVFNRSHYEEVLAVRVHPEFLKASRLPKLEPKKIWEERFDSIRDFERHLARNGTVILKFWLNVSKKEQKKRLLKRIDDPAANWKFEAGDVVERGLWDEYMAAYEEALSETSRRFAPWYAIPADDKRAMRLIVAEIVAEALEELDLSFPKLGDDARSSLAVMRERLEPPR